jgi:hypothetical protein
VIDPFWPDCPSCNEPVVVFTSWIKRSSLSSEHCWVVTVYYHFKLYTVTVYSPHASPTHRHCGCLAP